MHTYTSDYNSLDMGRVPVTTEGKFRVLQEQADRHTLKCFDLVTTAATYMPE